MQFTATETPRINPVMENILITDPLKLQGNPTAAADILEAMTESTLFQSAFTDIPKTSERPIDAPTISIDKYKLQELWCKGIINDLSYVAFALELHDKPTLDMQQFTRAWSVEDLSNSEKESGWKPKVLKVRSILNAICILDTKGMADCNFSAQVNQLSLFD
jgi:hypothetical protein